MALKWMASDLSASVNAKSYSDSVLACTRAGGKHVYADATGSVGFEPTMCQRTRQV